jgi:hypothetical protein
MNSPFPDPDTFYKSIFDNVMPNILVFVTACLSVLLAGLVIRAFIAK